MSILRALGQRFRAWLDDDGGAMSGFMLVMLPLLILAVLGLHAVWQIASVSHALRTGTYQAARFLSAEPPQTGRRADWERAAMRQIRPAFEQNVVIRANPEIAALPGVIINPVPNEDRCREAGPGGRVEFLLTAQTTASVRFFGVNATVNLRHDERGEVRCEQG